MLHIVMNAGPFCLQVRHVWMVEHVTQDGDPEVEWRGLQQRRVPQVCAAYLQHHIPGEHTPGQWMPRFYTEIS